MNKKVSGAKSVIVQITGVGKNYLPYVEYLNGRYIKYVDYVTVGSLVAKDGATISSTDNITVTLANSAGNAYFVKDEPLKRFDVEENLGIRKPIMQKISLQNSYLQVSDGALVGKSVVLTFWYDLPEYSSRNKSDNVITDGWETPIVSATAHNQMPDNRTMVNKRFRRLSVTFQSYLPTLTDGITMEQARHIYLTLQKGTFKVIDTVPICEFYEIGKLQGIEFANIVFDFTNSYLEVGSGATDCEGKSVLINAVYED